MRSLPVFLLLVSLKNQLLYFEYLNFGQDFVFFKFPFLTRFSVLILRREPKFLIIIRGNRLVIALEALCLLFARNAL